MNFKIIRFLIVLLFITNSYANVVNNIIVTSLSDDVSLGTLRWAINTANSDVNINQINFSPSLTGTITLASDLPSITSSVTIAGPGATILTISGNNSFNMFVLNNGSVLTISGVTLTKNKNFNGSVFRADNFNSAIFADSIIVTANTNSYAFYTNNPSSITFSNSTFSNNSATLFGSDYGSTPSTTSDVVTDYTNRITVTSSIFTGNATIFYTERYVKIENCTFTNNTGQIGIFRGLNRYQVLNSTFTDNTGYQLFSFSSSLSTGTFLSTLGTNHHLFDGNTFTGNTGTIINTGSVNEQSKTTIINNIFINNGMSYTGSPEVVMMNTLDNFITSVTHSVSTGTLEVTMSRPVFNTSSGSGGIEASDFELLLFGGNATLLSSTPSNISSNGNVYTFDIPLTGEISGEESITIRPLANSVYDASYNVAGISQQNSTIILNFLDDDADGVSNFLDLCPNTAPGVLVYPNDGCENTTYPFIMYLNYGLIFNYPNNICSTTDNNLYFIAYDSDWNSFIYSLSAENVLSTVSIPNSNPYNLIISSSNIVYTLGYNNNTQNYEIMKLSTSGTHLLLFSSNTLYINSIIIDSSDNLYFSCYNSVSQFNEIRKISADGTISVPVNNNTGYIFNLIFDNVDNLYFIDRNNSNTKIKKMASDGTISELYNTNGYIENLKCDTLGNLYILEYDNNTNAYFIKKLDSLGISTNLYNYGTSIYPNGFAIDAINNLYFVTYNGNSGEKQLYMTSPDSSVIPYGLFAGNQLTNDTNGKVFFDDFINKKIMGSKILQLAPIITGPNNETGLTSSISINENTTSVHTFSADEVVTWSLGNTNDETLLSIDSNGNLVFNTAPDFETPASTLNSNTYVVEIIATDSANNSTSQTLTITILDIANSTFGTFATITKQYFNGTHTIVSPTTNNSNLIVYSSDNLSVATISGSVITFTGVGTANITATQAADANYEGNSISTLLTVMGKDLVSKYGGISSTDVNYISANGSVGGAFGIDKFGKKENATDL